MCLFPIIFVKLVVFVKFLCVNKLPVVSPLTGALHVMDLILNLIILHCGNVEAFGLCFYRTNNIGKWKTSHHQEAAAPSRSRIQNKHIKNFVSESCSNFCWLWRHCKSMQCLAK